MLHIAGSGGYNLAIVGESNYQRDLVRIAGRRSTKSNRRVECAAVLHLETDNPHDRNAIRVAINGATVGYISRTDAPDLRVALAEYGILDGQQVEVDAVIVGGRQGNNYGVWLDLDLEDDDDDDSDFLPIPAKQARIPEHAPIPAARPVAQRRASPMLYVVSGLVATLITVLVVGGLVSFLMELF